MVAALGGAEDPDRGVDPQALRAAAVGPAVVVADPAPADGASAVWAVSAA